MKWLSFLTLILCIGPTSVLAQKTGVELFADDSVEGWVARGEVETFKAQDGVVRLLAKKNVWVVSEQTAKNFIFEAEIKLPEDAAHTKFNSGLGFRLVGDSGKPKGYQMEVDLKKPGAVYGIGLGGWLYPKGADEEAEYRKRLEGVYKPGQYNHYRVEAIGPRIRTWLNGKLVSEVSDEKSLKGRFGIQHHGSGGMVLFRKVRIERLPD